MAGPEDWKRCLDAGLDVSIHWDGDRVDAWIRAKDVEAVLDKQREVVFGPDIDGDATFCPKVVTIKEFE